MDTTYYSAGIERAWTNMIGFIPNFLAFLAILVVGYIAAVLIGQAVDKVLDRLGLDRMVERGGLKRVMDQAGYDIGDILGKVTFYAVFLFAAQLAFGVFGPNPISDLLNRIIAFLPNIFVAIVITVIAASIAAGVKNIVQASLGGLSYGRILANIAGGAILVVGIFAALNQLNIAPEIVNALFYSMLALIVGSAIVAIGGGGIVPMRAQWEKALNRIEQEAPRLKLEAQNARMGNQPVNNQMNNQPMADQTPTQAVVQAYNEEIPANEPATRRDVRA